MVTYYFKTIKQTSTPIIKAKKHQCIKCRGLDYFYDYEMRICKRCLK